jgi:glycosyltransferase involved in cell wall biosynthesis
MRILIVSFFFPPTDAIGALRVGKTARYLAAFGHDVHVVTAEGLPGLHSLPVELPEARIVRTPWLDLDRPWPRVRGVRATEPPPPVSAGTAAPPAIDRTSAYRRLRGALARAHRSVVHLPDARAGWAPFAFAAASRLARGARPDVVFASSGPATSLVVAAAVARRYGLPWVAELRDPWADNPYEARPGWRRGLDRALERAVLGSASGLVTVSEPLVQALKARFDVPVALVSNGFEPGEHPAVAPVAPRDRLRVVHTGRLYGDQRDPTPLFAAVAALGDDARRVHLAFYGPDAGEVLPVARRFGLEAQVEVFARVPYAESLRAQAGADVLLTLLRDDPRDVGVMTGKLPEYLGARRPILVVGPADNVAARLVTGRGLGFAGATAALLVPRLAAWLDEKQRTGAVAAVSPDATAGFTRRDQVRVLEGFLAEAVRRAGRPNGATTDPMPRSTP